MRAAFLGFVLGVAVMVVAAVVFQHEVIKVSTDDLDYHFSKYIFPGPEFPWGDLQQGRIVRRMLYPIKTVVTFYDSHYNLVTQADHAGRYGAVVRISLIGGGVTYRFATLYRTPVKVHWWETPIPITAQVPLSAGIDPAVLTIQGAEIGEAIKNDFFMDYGDNPNLGVLLAGLSETSPTDPPAVERTNVAARDAEWWFGLRQKLGLAQHYPFLTDLPRDYDADPARRWPLILFLHAGDQRGTDLKPVREAGLAGAITHGRQIPAIVISPQCPWGEDWNKLVLGQLIDEISAKYRVDPDRIYITGTSLGGDTAWDLAVYYPGRFAAIVPIAGEGDPTDVARLKDTPIWTFQGENDDNVPAIWTENMVDAIRKAGGHPHLTLYPGAPHDIWDRVYATEALYTWLFAQKRGQPEVVTPVVPTP